MTLNKKIDQYVWWVLQEIKKESVATPSDKYVLFEPSQDDNSQPEIKEQRRALKFLEKEGAIKIEKEHFPMGIPAMGADLYNWKPIKYFLDILQPRFDELFKEYGTSNAPQSEFSGNLNEFCFDSITEKIFYKYDDYSKEGKLKIGTFPEISFKKIPADILQFFFTNEKMGNDYKNYKNFNKFTDNEKNYSKPIKSDDFNKKISIINKRVGKGTNNLVKEIIQKGKNKSQEANIYRWNEKIT